MSADFLFRLKVTGPERLALLDDLANWPKAQRFEVPISWVSNGQFVTLMIIGTDCEATASYLRLAYG